MKPEFIVLTINIVLILFTYLVIYPRFAGANETKIMTNDLVATAFALFAAGSIYWGTGYQFNLLITTVNWFWFSLLTFFAMELPFFIWYAKKHRLFDKYFEDS